jgi:hypothetical protein
MGFIAIALVELASSAQNYFSAITNVQDSTIVHSQQSRLSGLQ